VSQDLIGCGVAVAITMKEEEGQRRHVLHLGPDGARNWESVVPGASTPPTFHLGDEEATALLAALASHYQGVDDQRALRKDYDHERGRVDKLTDALIGIVQKAAGG
jgi:hypothetical protein